MRLRFLWLVCNTRITFKHTGRSSLLAPRFGHTIQPHRGPLEAGYRLDRRRRATRQIRNRGRATRDYGSQDQFEVETAEPARHRRPGPRATSRLLLRDGSDHRADPSAVRRCCHLLERGSALQYRADAPGAGREERRCLRRRHPARILHHHRHRRHRHGPCRHEVLAAFARGYRRQRRTHRARPCL